MATSIFKEYFKGYEILGELGRGNARVLKAKNLQTGTLVAIKHFAFNTEPDTLRRFQRESEIMKSIEHHYVVKILEVHLDAELPYIVMELIEGGDLRSLLKSYGSLDISTVVTLAQQMTEALDTIHGKAIVHRDVKPENIMYRRLDSGELQFLLTDFGIARLREQSDAITVTGASMLTYDYASPEQFNQSKNLSAATDYYSLGVVLYECLTGAVPFEYEQDDLLMHINRVISAPIPVPLIPHRQGFQHGPHDQQLPPSLLQLLENLLRKQSSVRLSDPVSIRHLLKMAVWEDLQGIKATPADQSSRTLQYQPAVVAHSKRKHRPSFALALLLIAIAILFSWTNMARRTNKSFETGNPVTASLPLVETRHTLPAEASHIVHTRLTPEVNTGNTHSSIVDPGIALINGIYYNDFDQQDSVWETGRDENSEFILLDGKYTMRGFRDSLSYSSSIKLKMDTEKDFTIAATAVHEGDGAGDPYGIIFCGDEVKDAYLVFYITSNGYYSIGTSVKDAWNASTDWTASPNLRQDAEMNTFSIERRGNVLRFIINDKLEKILPFAVGYGSYFGLRVDGEQTISFDQFVVKGSSASVKPI